MLEILTFTGVDEMTKESHLADIARSYPKVEFGVLVGSRSDTYESHGIFPSFNKVRVFRDYALNHGVQASLHLCGTWARTAIKATRAPVSPA